MPDQKKNLFIFNFNKHISSFLKGGLLFFTPVIIFCILLELLILITPTSFSIIGNYFDEKQESLEIVIFGSSQILNSINPKFLEKPSINFSSGMQHHNTDFKILDQTRARLKNLKTVVFEVSYGHFEVRHNSRYFWKNNVFLKYYGVNLKDRNTYPSDYLLYTSNPAFFSRLLYGNYLKNDGSYQYNAFGFNKNKYEGKFKTLNYDTILFNKSYVKINRRADKNIFKHNVSFFYNMLDYCENEGLNIVIISPPTFNNYNDLRNPVILKRRDSILSVISEKYKNIYFLNSEQDEKFTAKMFWDEKHLNPDGAELFTSQLNELINSIE